MPPVRRSEATQSNTTHRTHTLRPLPIPRGHSRRPTRFSSPLPTPAEEDLRRYLGAAQLPTIARFDKSSPYRLPPKGRRTHKNKLRVRHDPDRQLEQIRQHDAKAFNDAVKTYHKDFVFGREGRPYAGKHYRHRPGESLVLPAPKFVPEDTFENTPYPCNIQETCRWIVERPIKTMQRAIHLAFPDTTRWWLDEPKDEAEQPTADKDGDLWRTYIWRFHPDEFHQTWWRDVPSSDSGVETEPAPHESVVFAVQPHWILGPQDLNNVADCTGLPSFSDDGTPPETALTSDERVWAKLYDTCKRHDCATFALTTYHGWLFGAFSEDWTTARISKVKEFDAKRPTVIQSLIYWVASSMGLAGALAAGIPVEETESSSEDSSEV